MEQKEQHLRSEFAELEQRLADPAIFTTREYPRLAKRRQQLEHVLGLFDDRASLAQQQEEATSLVDGGDPELISLLVAGCHPLRDHPTRHTQQQDAEQQAEKSGSRCRV